MRYDIYIHAVCIVNVSAAGGTGKLRATGAASVARGPLRGPFPPYLNALFGPLERNAPLLAETKTGDVSRVRFRGIRFHRWRIAILRSAAYFRVAVSIWRALLFASGCLVPSFRGVGDFTLGRPLYNSQ